jgi:lipopolysaccharide cholinephosphotransferase
MDDLRKLQLIELDILKEFIRICDMHNLKYYATSGTALGAVRHKGFIPWDDDIDVSMPRSDYDKFMIIAPKDIPRHREIRTISNYENHLHPFMQFVDKSVKTVISKANNETNHNAYIDIFPLDGMPNNKILRYLHTLRFLVCKCLFHISVFNERVDQTKKRPFYEKVILWCCNNFNIQKFFDKHNRVTAGDKILKKYSFDKTNYCSPQLWGLYKTKAIFPTDWIGEGVLLPFEDTQIMVPLNYNNYLNQLYGSDYMELPPLERRSTHFSKIIIQNDELCDEWL